MNENHINLFFDGAVAGTIAENLPGTQTSYQWQAGKMTGGWASPGTDLKVRVTAAIPSSSSGTTYYFYDSGGRLLSEYDSSGSCVKDYLYLGGKMIGEYVPSSSSYYYYGSDQINSTRLVTDSTGAVVHSAQYDPYGGLYKIWIDTYHPKPGFSGKEREFGSEMDYFGARYYGHAQHRFLSADPIINKDEAIANPQLWNLYSYCRNNPMTYLDQDGKIETKLIDLGIEYANNEFVTEPYARMFTPQSPLYNGVMYAAKSSVDNKYHVEFRYVVFMLIKAPYRGDSRIAHEKDHIAGFNWLYEKNVGILKGAEAMGFNSPAEALEYGEKVANSLQVPKKWKDLAQGFLGTGILGASNEKHVEGWKEMRKNNTWE